MKRFILFLAATAASCKSEQAPPTAGKNPGGGSSIPERVYPVEVKRVLSEQVQYSIEAFGSLEAQEEVHVPARVAGVAEKVYFEEGTRVTPETVLAEIDPERYRLLASKAQATYDKSVAEVEKAQTFLNNRLALKAKNPDYVTKEELATVTSQLDGAKAALAEAKAALDVSQQDLGFSKVRSLITGIISSKSVSTGQYVNLGNLIASIVDTSKLKLRFKVTESESVKLQALWAGDRRLTFSVRPIPGRTFQAVLTYVSPQANPQTRSVECLALIPNPDPTLKPGFFAIVRTVVDTHEKAIVVSDTAVMPTERGFFAFVVANERAEQRQIRTGLFVREGAVEILEGLKEGDALVVGGASALRSGVKVKIVPAGEHGTR